MKTYDITKQTADLKSSNNVTEIMTCWSVSLEWPTRSTYGKSNPLCEDWWT